MASTRILLIDDDEHILTALEQVFQKAGFEVTTAKNGTIGVEKATGEKPDFILTDMVMFPIDGIEVIRQIRLSGSWGAKVPCAIYSSETEELHKKAMADLDISAFYSKRKYDPDQLVSLIQHSHKS